jgi:hypothetical protein
MWNIDTTLSVCKDEFICNDEGNVDDGDSICWTSSDDGLKFDWKDNDVEFHMQKVIVIYFYAVLTAHRSDLKLVRNETIV